MHSRRFMIPARGDRILFLNTKDRLRAGSVEELLEEDGQVVLFVSTDAGTETVPLQRLQSLVTLRAEPLPLFSEFWE